MHVGTFRHGGQGLLNDRGRRGWCVERIAGQEDSIGILLSGDFRQPRNR